MEHGYWFAKISDFMLRKEIVRESRIELVQRPDHQGSSIIIGARLVGFIIAIIRGIAILARNCPGQMKMCGLVGCLPNGHEQARSEERRVGKEGRYGLSWG